MASIEPWCPSGGNWFACTTGSLFVGCCTSTNACDSSVGCNDGNLRAASFNATNLDGIRDQECPVGAQWYTCKNSKPPFVGCCKTNPCNNGCPQANLAAGILNTAAANGFATSMPTSSSSMATQTASVTATSSTGTGSSAPPPPPVSHAASKGLAPGAVAGIAVGSAVLVALIAGLLFFLLRRRRRETKSSMEVKILRQGASGDEYDPFVAAEQENRRITMTMSNLNENAPPVPMYEAQRPALEAWQRPSNLNVLAVDPNKDNNTKTMTTSLPPTSPTPPPEYVGQEEHEQDQYHQHANQPQYQNQNQIQHQNHDHEHNNDDDGYEDDTVSPSHYSWTSDRPVTGSGLEHGFTTVTTTGGGAGGGAAARRSELMSMPMPMPLHSPVSFQNPVWNPNVAPLRVSRAGAGMGMGVGGSGSIGMGGGAVGGIGRMSVQQSPTWHAPAAPAELPARRAGAGDEEGYGGWV